MAIRALDAPAESTGFSLSRKMTDLARRGGRRANTRPVDQSVKLGYLRQVDILSPLSPDEHAWVAENTTMVTCPRGRIFYTPDDPGEVIFLLKQGRVSLYRLTPEGRKLTVATLDAGTCFGEMGLLGQGMYGCHAEAATDCLLCVMSRSDLQALIRRNPDVAIRLLDVLGNRLREREQDLEHLAFRGIPARLAALLLREADVFGTISGQSHQDFADRLGTYRETVSQTLGRFRTEGLVAIEPKRVRLLDPDGLRAYAEG
jgi:CRP/FNR family transcriptional regulator, cyclic AMP receptor protein